MKRRLLLLLVVYVTLAGVFSWWIYQRGYITFDEQLISEIVGCVACGVMSYLVLRKPRTFRLNVESEFHLFLIGTLLWVLSSGIMNVFVVELIPGTPNAYLLDTEYQKVRLPEDVAEAVGSYTAFIRKEWANEVVWVVSKKSRSISCSIEVNKERRVNFKKDDFGEPRTIDRSDRKSVV